MGDDIYNQHEQDMADVFAERVSKKLGQHIMIRFDPLRTQDCWTVVIDGIRLCDTDKPFTRLLAYVKSLESEKLDQQKKGAK
jgi:hypothetical protein